MADYAQSHPFYIVQEARQYRRIVANAGGYASWWSALHWSWGWYTGWPFPWMCRTFGHKWNGWNRCGWCWAYKPDDLQRRESPQEGL